MDATGTLPIVWPGGRVDVLYEHFKQRIIDRLWLPGQQLNIDRLAREHNVSTTPVREALARLSADRLVVVAQYRGYTVAPVPSAACMAELFTVRLLLEPHAAHGAATRIAEGDLGLLRAIHEAMEARGAGADYQGMHSYGAHNRSFHELIFRANGNAALAEIYGRLNYHVLIEHVFHAHGVMDVPEVLAEHRAILEALEARDPAAAEGAMHAHIERGGRHLLEIGWINDEKEG